MREHFDTIILGAGVAGSAAALALTGRQAGGQARGRAKGQGVLLLEQGAFLHKNGSSHGGSRIFRHAYEDPRYVTMAVAADEAWQALERNAGERLLYRSGGLDIGSEDNLELARIAAALCGTERPHEALDHRDVKRRFPAFRLQPGQIALYSPDAGILPATHCLQVMQAQAARRGAELRAQERVLDLELGPSHVRVRTERTHYEAGRLVVTAGPWLSELADRLGLGLPLRVERQQVLYLRVEERAPHLLERCPIFINRDNEVYGFPLFEREDAIKVSNHAGAPTITLSERTFDLHEDAAERTAAQIRAFMPRVGAELVHFETCLYTKTPDEHFILDLHPEHEHVAIGGGFSGHGFKFGPLLGEILADLLEGRRGYDLSLFTLSRFAPQSAPQFAP